MGAFDDLIPASQSANPGAFDDLIPVKPAGGLAAAAKQAIGAGIKGAGRAAADFIPGVTPANPISQYGQEVIDANPTAVQSFSDIADSPWTAVKEAVGNAGGSMAGMLGARALGTGITMAAPFTGPAAPLVGLAGQAIANVGPFVAAALPSYGGIREEQIKADPANAADAKSKAIAMLGAVAVGAIEGAFGPEAWALAAAKKGGIEAMVKKLADAKSIPAAIGKGIMRGGAIEGAEELVQNPIEQVAGYQDPTTRQAIGETLFGGAMGAIGGGVLGGGMGGFAKAMEPEQAPPTAATAAPTQGPQQPAGTTTAPAAAAHPAATAPATPAGPLVSSLAAVGINPTGATNDSNFTTGNDAGASAQMASDAGNNEASAPSATVAGAGGTGTGMAAAVHRGTGESVLARSDGNAPDNGIAPDATAPVTPSQNQAVTLPPEQQQAIAAPQITPHAPVLPVTPAAPTTNQQAESSGAPTTPQGNQNGNQTEIPEPAAAGRSSQPATGAGQGVAPALQYPQQPTTGGGAIEQQPAPMSLGEYGKRKQAIADASKGSGMSPKSVSGTPGNPENPETGKNGKSGTSGKSEDEPVRGAVGMKLSAGQVVTTLTGRTTTPFPKFQSSTGKMTQAHLNAVDRWLLSNAAEEAESRGDDFNALPFRRALESKTIPQADKDSAEMYLFEWQPDVIKPITRPLVPESKSPPVAANETAPDAPQAPLSSAGESQDKMADEFEAVARGASISPSDLWRVIDGIGLNAYSMDVMTLFAAQAEASRLGERAKKLSEAWGNRDEKRRKEAESAIPLVKDSGLNSGDLVEYEAPHLGIAKSSGTVLESRHDGSVTISTKDGKSTFNGDVRVKFTSVQKSDDARKARSLGKGKSDKNNPFPKNIAEAEIAAQDSAALSGLSSFLKSEKDAASTAEKRGAWKDQFKTHAEIVAALDILGSDQEKLSDFVYRGSIAANRAIEMIDSAVGNGVLDRIVGDHLKKKVSEAEADATRKADLEKRKAELLAKRAQLADTAGRLAAAGNGIAEKSGAVDALGARLAAARPDTAGATAKVDDAAGRMKAAASQSVAERRAQFEALRGRLEAAKAEADDRAKQEKAATNPAAPAKKKPTRASGVVISRQDAVAIIVRVWQSAAYNKLKWQGIKARVVVKMAEAGASKPSVIAALDDAMTEFARTANGMLGYPNESIVMRAMIGRGIVEQQAEAQHIEGKTVEPVTAPVIAESIAKGARNTGTDLRKEHAALLAEIDAAIAKAPTVGSRSALGTVVFKIGSEKDDKQYVPNTKERLQQFRNTFGLSADAVNAVDKAIEKAPSENDAPFVTFDVPGDGKFKIPNTKEELASFRKKLGAKPGAGFRTEPKRAPHKTPMERIDGGKASDATIREMLQDGDLTAALELSKVVGRPLVFGAYDATKVDAPLTYTDASPFAPAGFESFGLVSARNSTGSMWSVIEPSTGLGIGVGQSRTEIEKSAANELAKTSPQGLSDALERLKKSGKAKDQSMLEAEWIKWAEQEEYDKDHAAEIAEKAEKAKAAALAADRAKWEKLTGEKPDFAPGARNPLDPAYMNPVSVLEDYQKAKANGKGDEYLDYAESKLDEEIAGHKPTIEAIRRIRSGNVGNWQYVGTQGAGGLPRHEKIVRTSDGREIRATIDGDISAYGFVREDNAIKSRIGDAGSLTFQQAREQADRAIDALMKPKAKNEATAEIPPSVMAAVRRALDNLRDIEQKFESVEKARGKGHILALEVRDQQEAIKAARARLDQFRALAKGKEIDADAVIAGLGGDPDFGRFGAPADESKTEEKPEAQPAWHTALPTEGLPITDDQRKSMGYEKVGHAIAADAYAAITQNQLLANGEMYAYYIPAADGRNGIARLLPDDQAPGKPWVLLNGEAIRPGMATKEQVIYKLTNWLRSARVVGDTNAPKAAENKPAKPAPAVDGKPDPGRYVAPSNKGNGATSQRIMADRAGVTATLTMLNEAVRKTNPDAAYADSEILNVATDRMDAVRDWLIANQKAPGGKTETNTEDAGSELTYNRRNRLNRGLKWADIADKDEALRVKEATKAKVYPKPDYKAMIGGGMAPQLAHIVKQVYDSISAAPQTRRSAAPSDDDIKNYIAGVNRVMDAVVGWANDADRGGKWLAYAVESSLRAYSAARSLIAAAGNNDVGQSLLSIAFPDGYEPVKNELIAIGGNKVYGALQPHSRELQDAIKDIKAGWPEPQESWQRQGFSIINGDGVKADPVAGDYGRLSVTVRMTAPNETFSRTLRVISVDGTRDIASPEVRSAIDRGLAEFAGRFVLLNKTKSVVSTHATEEEAKEAARAQARRSGRASTVSDKGISVVAAERTGADRRMPGEDISSDRLRDTFKFKGVNFGNWMKGDANTKERQLHLNHAYDAFLDLADVLGVPPEAMSLDGMLGVAIGAQGHGGNAAAHFVPGVNEINLTRESGAGSLAHEWGHALDHYFARQAGLTRATGPFLTSHLKAAAGSELRPEILDKFKTIVQAMHKRPMTPEEADAKRQEGIASARRNLDGWLKNVIRGDLMDDPEVSKAIERIKSGDLGDGSVAVGRTSVVKPAIADLGKIIKEKAGRVLQRTDLSAIDSWAGKLKYLQGQNDGDAAHVPQQIVETQYFKAATSLDKDKGGKPYWSTTLEMFARAFDAFVSDTLEAKAAKNSYLSHAGRGGETVPAGGERTAINAAIQGLVDAVETKAGEDGNVLLYNVAADDNTGLSAAIEGAKAAREQMNRFREDSPVEDADSYFDIIGKVIAADKAVAAKIAEIADDGFAVMAKTRDGRMVTLTKSAQRSGKYQVTTFGKDGAPWGDTQHDTKMGAAKQFVEDVDVNTIEVADGINYNLATDTKSSPSDRAIYSMVAEGKTAAEILSFIGKASRRPFNRYLANALRNLGAASTLTLDSQGGWRFGNTSQAQRYAAAYNPKTDTVALFTARDAERHTLHELTHAATLKAIAAGGPASLQMRALFLHIKRNGSLDGQYGMSNLDEFVAEAFSNPKFQAALKAIPAPKGSALRNAWEWFVRTVARALGLKSPAMETALDRAMVEGAKLMRENAALSGQMDGSDRYALAWHGTPHVWAPEPGFPHGRPRLDKMGTGEGAQAYGWGWYSAQEKETAEWYRRNVSGAAARVSLDGSPLLGGHYGTWPGKFGISSAVADRLNMWRAMAESGKSTSVADAPASLRKRLSISQVGNTYQLDIPDDVMPNLLDWDKPLSEQTAQVRNALLRAGVTITKSTYPTLKQAAALFRSARVQREAASDIGVRESLREGWLAVQSGNQSAFNKWFDKHGSTLSPGRKMDRTGEALYEEFSSSKEGNLGYSKQRASEYLASIGIVGTRYLDGQSRDGGIGTSNYVIWDQPTLDRIALLERNGEKLDAIREADAARYNVEPLPDTITINGTERPTTNSNGKPIAQDEASIRRFWEWFGDSRVVDEQGRPLVVYHSTLDDKTQFDRTGRFMGHTGTSGISVTDSPEMASRYLDRYGSFRYDGKAFEKNVMPVYVRAENPLYRDEPFPTGLRLGAPLPKGYVSPVVQQGYDSLVRNDAISRAGGVKHSGAKNAIKGREIILFDPNQIKSATGNNGQFSPDNPDIRYNAATDWYDNNAPQSVKSVVANAMRSDAKTSWLTPFNTQYHKAEKWAKEGRRRFKTVFDLVQRFLGDVSKFAVLSQNAAPTLFHEWRTLADVRATLSSGDMLGKQHRADVAAIASPLYEGTLYGGGNPMSGIKWSDAQLRTKFSLTDRQIKLYREALSAVNVSMDELAKSIVAQHAKANNIRFDREAGLADMIRDVTEGLESAKEDLEALLDQSEKERVDGEAADLRDMDMNQEADSLLAQFERDQKDAAAGVARIEKTISDVKEIGAKNAKLQAAGYFPLMRFGKHTVTATDQDGKVQFFGMYEGVPLIPRSGQYEANKVAADLRAEFPGWTVTTGIKNDEKYKLYQGLNIEAIQLFAEHMDKDSLEPFQEFIRLATNNRSAQRRLLHRQGTPGFDKDVRRTLAQFMVSNARAASSNYHVQDMLRAAADAEKDGGDIGSEAVKLVNYVRNPTEEAQALRGFLFFQFLGGSLASAAVNLTQTPMMTLPFLSQFEPAGALIQRLTQAAKLAVQKVEKIPNQRLREALERAEMDGVTAPQEIYQLTATAANNIFAGSRLASALLRGWGAPFAMAEGFNRRIAFISAFQIAEKMGPADLLAKTGFRDAFAFAEDAVNQTQGIYNKGNRMNVGRGTAGSVLMTFKQYSIMYLELLKRLPPKQRAIMVGLLVLSAGGGGLPGVEDAEDLWDTIGQWLGFASNSKRTLRNTLTEWMGRDAADMAMNGLLSRVGIDLHGRMGMHNLIPGTGIMKQSSVDKGRDLEEFFGPAASVVKSVGDALESLATGHPDRAAMALAPSAVRNLAQGAKMADKGYSEDAKGRKGVPVNGAESGAKMIGFNPKSVADYGSIKRDLAQDQRMVAVKREEFSSAIADAIIADDPAARAEAMQSLLAWNAENPSARVTITSAAIAKRVRDARAEGATRMLRSLPKGVRNQAREEFAQ